MVDKVVIVLGGLGLIGTSVAAVATNGFGLWKVIPWNVLSEDSDFNTKNSDGGDYKDKFGSKYSKYLTGLDEKNKEWWKNKFEKIKDSKPTSGKFKDIDKGYDVSNSLKSKCEEAYKKQETELKGDTDTIQDTEYKKSEAWKFCSPGVTKPKMVEEVTGETYTSSNLGETKKSQILSINSKDNQWIWDLKNKEFFNDKHSKQGYFKKFYTDNKDKREKTIKDGCKGAYGKEENTSSTGDDKLTGDDVLKWCAL